MKIDIHTHILPLEIPKFKDKFGYDGFIEMHEHVDCCGADMVDDKGNFFREVKPNCYQPEARIHDCDEHKVDIQVLSTVPVMFSYWTKPKDGEYVSQFLNDHIKSVCEAHPKRFIGLGTLPMQAPELSVKEIERLHALGIPGVEIGSHINDKNLEDESFYPIWEALEDKNMCVFVHPWDMMGKKNMPKYWLPWLVGMPAESSLAICSLIFGGVFKKFPKLRFAFAHGGGSFPMTIGRISHGHHVRPDLCAVDNQTDPREYLGHFWLDSLVHDPKVLEYIVDLVGEDRIALGTDYPFPLGELTPGQLIESSQFSAEIKQKLLADNAFNWLGLDKKNYL